jgi:pimeloyl-ACP methyl ester carboxylesterase
MAKMPLILLSGTLCDATLWGHQLTHLHDVAQVSVGDLTRDAALSGMARTVLQVAPLRFALAGLSMGGVIAFEIMRQAPDRVLRLALLNTNARAFTPEQRTRWQGLVDIALQGRFSDIVERIWLDMIFSGRQVGAELRAVIQRMAKDVGAEAFVRQVQSQLDRPDSRPMLAQISCPTLVLAGRQDETCPMGLHEEMANAIPYAHLVVVEQCGHYSVLEQPQAVTALLRYWLQLG